MVLGRWDLARQRSSRRRPRASTGLRRCALLRRGKPSPPGWRTSAAVGQRPCRPHLRRVHSEQSHFSTGRKHAAPPTRRAAPSRPAAPPPNAKAMPWPLLGAVPPSTHATSAVLRGDSAGSKSGSSALFESSNSGSSVALALLWSPEVRRTQARGHLEPRVASPAAAGTPSAGAASRTCNTATATAAYYGLLLLCCYGAATHLAHVE
eukprot:scaffold8647_cov33-Phaeocystis_antarctica.AAC.1